MNLDNDTIFIDLFGGSFYLSYLAKQVYPKCKVICNDYDNYRERLENISTTNKILSEIREEVKDTKHGDKLNDTQTENIRKIIKSQKYIDYITLSSNLFYSGYVAYDVDDLFKNVFWNKISKGYKADVEDYLSGIEFVKSDWYDLFSEYRGKDNVVFIADPPYGLTYCGGYKDAWDMLKTYKTLEILKQKRFVYFTSSKTGLIELIDYLNDTYKEDIQYKKEIIKRSNVNRYRIENIELLLYR